MKKWIQLSTLLLATFSAFGTNAQKTGINSGLQAISNPERPAPSKTFNVDAEKAFRFAIQHGYAFYPEFISNESSPARTDYDGNAITGVKCAAQVSRFDCRGFSQMSRGTAATIYLPCEMYIRQGNGRTEPVICSNTFHFFKGKKLNPGWTLENVGTGPTQDAHWVTSRDKTLPHIKVTVTRSKSPNRRAHLTIHSLELRGPSNGKWQDAFDSRYKALIQKAKR